METNLCRFLWRRRSPEFPTISPAEPPQTRPDIYSGRRCSQISFSRVTGGPFPSYQQTSINHEKAWKSLAARNIEDGKRSTLRIFRTQKYCLLRRRCVEIQEGA